jgi:hypothetical protein
VAYRSPTRPTHPLILRSGAAASRRRLPGPASELEPSFETALRASSG